MGTLLQAKPANLKKYGEAFARALEIQPEGIAFLLVAHAKAFQAKEVVERLSLLPSWSDHENARIARAALGNTQVEDAILAEVKRLEEAGDVETLTARGAGGLLYVLGRIGTHRSLMTLAKLMRSPLERIVNGTRYSGRETIRLYVMNALRYSFPDQADKLLNRNLVKSEEDYLAVERFLTRELGISYDDMPMPEFTKAPQHDPALLIASCMGCQQAMTVKGDAAITRTAESYIEAFRRGEEFDPPSEGLIADGRLSRNVAAIFREELEFGRAHVREQIAALLWDLSRRTNPERPYELRDPEIIALYAGPALSDPCSVKSYAMRALLHVKPAKLKKYREAITSALKDAPEGYAFLLVAHAKAFQAKEVVERLSLLPRWSTHEYARVAQAALGNTQVEDAILAEVKRLEEAGDVDTLLTTGVGGLLYTLARIGTHRSLTALAKFMRSPLERIVGHGNWGRETIRLYVMDALRYPFPDQADKLLNRNLVESEEDYLAVERFLTRELGISYEGMPMPRFITTTPTPAPPVPEWLNR
jgi:hypothetical protein